MILQRKTIHYLRHTSRQDALHKNKARTKKFQFQNNGEVNNDNSFIQKNVHTDT